MEAQDAVERPSARQHGQSLVAAGSRLPEWREQGERAGEVVGLVGIGQPHVRGAVVYVLRVAVGSNAALVVDRLGQRVRQLERQTLTRAFSDGNLQRIVPARAYALVEPLRQHVRGRVTRGGRPPPPAPPPPRG